MRYHGKALGLVVLESVSCSFWESLRVFVRCLIVGAFRGPVVITSPVVS